MNTSARLRFSFSGTAIVLNAYIVSALAWWWWRNGATIVSDRTDAWLSYLSTVFWLPGGILVSIFEDGQEELNTKSTDLFIPLLSGIIWGIVMLLILRFFRGAHSESR
jgi:hypothetical protein